MGIAATAAKLGLDHSSAQHIIQSFFNHFSQVRQWTQRVKAQAHRFLLVKTLLGRQRHLPLINSDDSAQAATAERQAVNSIIQGTASDLIKLAMVQASRELLSWEEDQGTPTPRLVMQIHDELMFEVPEQCVDQFVAVLRRVMEREVVEALRLTVPLVANIAVGQRWGEMRAISATDDG